MVLDGVPFSVTVQGSAPGAAWTAGGETAEADAEGNATLAGIRHSAGPLQVQGPEGELSAEPVVLPGWVSLLPPLLAILLALLLRQVVLALAAGVWLGAFFVGGFDPLGATLRLIDHYAVGAVADEDHAAILVFSLLLGGMIGVITRSGGGAGLAQLVTKRATDDRKGLLATWSLGVVVFFDDYANALLVGSSMRPITDRLRISREKLAFLVDATAAPVSSVALVSSWIGVEVGYIADQLSAEGITSISAYSAFLQTLPYRFYPWLMLAFGLALVLFRRDFGPMWKAERRAREEGKLVADGANPASQFDDADANAEPRWLNAALPVTAVVMVALVGMYIDGLASARETIEDPGLRDIFGAANSLHVLLWASAAGAATAVISSVASGAMNLEDTLESWLGGMRSMLLACIILVLAWSLGTVCRELHTADFVVQGIGSWLPAAALPAAVFVIAGLVSFATGTSWGTMAILFPLVVPLAAQLSAAEIAAEDFTILFGAISSILAGSVFGDHCSPISDTTIMSSMASSCDHVDHVRTQLPYALVVGGVAVVIGELGTAFGLYPASVALVLGVVIVVAIARFVGKPLPEVPGTEASPGE